MGSMVGHELKYLEMKEETSMKYFFSTTAVWTLVGQALASKCSERRTQ